MVNQITIADIERLQQRQRKRKRIKGFFGVDIDKL